MTASKGRDGTRLALPLAGRRIVVTRAREQAERLVERLRGHSAIPLEYPAISIAPLDDPGSLDKAVSRLEDYDWVIFTSVNGAQAFADRMLALGKDLEALCSRKLGAIGPATAEALVALGCPPDFVPGSYVAEAIIDQIGDIKGCRVLLPRADIARKALADGLRAKGAEVDEVAAYRTVHGEAASSLADLLVAGGVDAVTFTSSSTVRYTIDGLISAGLDLSQAIRLLNSTAIVCIGPITAGTAKECRLNVASVAEEYTSEGLVDALVKFFAGQLEEADKC